MTRVLKRLSDRCLADMKALGPKPWFWQRKKRKAWKAANQALVIQYLRDTAYVLHQIAQGVTPIDWVSARTVDEREVN